MATKKGMDISVFQGDISWSKVTGIDFVIIRAGYGKNNIDTKAVQNIKGCTDRKIPFGLYWFSYALSVSDAAKEADYVCDIADKYKITFPVIAYDWEYDSDDYAAEKGVSMTNDKRYQFAVAFLKRVKERGYTPVIYTNYDYLNKGFKALTSAYDVWFAYPGGDSKPSITGLTIWQYSWKGDVPGINADVDMNYCYKEYGKATPTPTPAPAVDEKQKVIDMAYYLVDHDKHPDRCDIMNWYGSFSTAINAVACCCAGMMYLFNEAGLLNLIPGGKVADCGSLCRNFYNAGQLYGPNDVKPGDLVIFSWSKERSSYWPASELGYKTLDHVELCVEVYGDTIKCIGANNGGVECDDFQIKIRSKSNISCCCRPKYSNSGGGDGGGSSAGTPTVTYKVKAGGKWLPAVTDLEDYAGVTGKAITDVAVKVSKGSVKYRVHVKGGGWLPYVTGYNTNDYNNGYAGNGKAIDAIEVYYFTPTDVAQKNGYLRAKYRVAPIGGKYYSWQYDNEKTGGQDGYAGSFGKAIDWLQITLSK